MTEANNFNYDALIKEFGQQEVEEAIAYCKDVAEMAVFKPSYFESKEEFLPHAWVVAAVIGIVKSAERELKAAGISLA